MLLTPFVIQFSPSRPMRRCRAHGHRVAVASKISSGVKLKECPCLAFPRKLKKSVAPNTLTRARVGAGRARRSRPAAQHQAREELIGLAVR